MEDLLINISLPEALAILVFGMIIGAIAATTYWIIPGVIAEPERRESEEVEL